MIKFKRFDYWKKVQEVLNFELQEDIYKKTTQPDESKKLLEDIQLFLDNWTYPKLFLPQINILTRAETIRALYKGLVKLISIDCAMPYDMFSSIVATILRDVKKNWEYLEVKIYSGIEEKKIGGIKYHF